MHDEDIFENAAVPVPQLRVSKPRGAIPCHKPTSGDLFVSGLSPSYKAKGYFSSLAVDPHTAGTVYAAVATWDGAEGGLWKSSDAGATWQILPLSTGSVSAVTVDPQASSKLYAATVGGVIRSTDGGQSWTAIPGNIGWAAALVWDPQRPNTLFAAGTGELWAIDFEQ